MSYAELPQAVTRITVLSIHLYVLTILTTALAKSSSCLRAVEPSLQRKEELPTARTAGGAEGGSAQPSQRKPSPLVSQSLRSLGT